MYQTYVMQKGVQNIEVQLKTTLEQIGKYTENAIKPSIVVNDNGNYQDITYVSRTDGELDSPNKLFMWIGKDVESMQGIWNGSRIYPGYSGLADLENSNNYEINTTGCDLNNVENIVKEIADIDTYSETSALYFVYANSLGSVKERFWDNGANLPTSLFSITSFNGADSNISLNNLNSKPDEIGDIYYLTYSAYGIRLDNNGELKLIWNFRPWKNETHNNGSERLLAENITKFQAWSESGGSIIRFYICATDDDIKIAGASDNWEYCKESTVVR